MVDTMDGTHIELEELTLTLRYIATGTKGVQLGKTKWYTSVTIEHYQTVTQVSTSDYYAYLEAIWTFRNPEATNINVFCNSRY
jgi:hypothetical protein